ncbi:MAG: hypothetical protein QHH10_08160 [Peptococcaceae bacterium]|jgi:hypothetical protein|nr:hypothetical protein [Peptococcaceae bacterium]MDH7525267.1 hypothetical protein [Peptococcaceae bacterium]
MNYQDAINHLSTKKADIELSIGLIKQGNEFISRQSTPLLEAIDLAISVLDKQIQKAVVTTPDKHRYGYCPVCGKIYWDKCHVGNYCDACGQALQP